jgi:ATPase family associated with various cellular activities (AAA)
MAISPQDFGASFKGFLDQMSAAAPVEEPIFRRRLRDHFECEPNELPTLSEKFPTYDHANVHSALEVAFTGTDCSVATYGVTNPHPYMSATLSTLAAPGKAGLMGGEGLAEGPVEYANITLDDDRVVACVQSGLFLVKRAGEPLAVLISGPAKEFHPMAQVGIQVMARSRDAAEKFMAGRRTFMRKRTIYRGHVISLAETRMGNMEIKFHRLPGVPRDSIILPKGLLERIERQTVRFSELSEKLVAAGRHLKRGILLHGPPGTGKTLTAMYVARAIQNRTVLLLTGRGQGMIEQSCALARALQPAIVILEDVDLVAEERTRPGAACAGPLLFELLNQMDGLADDADVLFLLTTNRPDILEPALAARPGRVDQAIEIPLPDAECRGRLFKLYSDKLTLGKVNWEKFIRRTDGASAAFIREMMRKAALFAADESSYSVEDRHLDEAIHELVIEGGSLTQNLLGFGSANDVESMGPPSACDP